MTPKRRDKSLPSPLSPDDVVEYAIYTHKSTESDEKQKASIPQQIKLCLENADRKNPKINLMLRESEIDVQTLDELADAFGSNPALHKELKDKYLKHEIITERHSAKEGGKRPLWGELMTRVKRGEVRGLFGYAPDRFARNLQEGGDLIQLADKKVIRLDFTNFVFENTASGQMMLGIWFVFAEHYSKKLSEDSLRGTREKTLQGRTQGVVKMGYMKSDSETDQFVPHPKNFTILRKA